jgi:hypothetical protein
LHEDRPEIRARPAIARMADLRNLDLLDMFFDLRF